MSKGVIYILTNPAFDEYVKIGYASNLENRLKTLNNSSALPYAFRVYAVYEVDSKLTDKELHKLIDTLNPDLRAIEHFDGKTRTKEFFAMSPEDAYTILECIAKISGTQKSLKRMKPEGHEVLDEKTAKEIKEEARKGPFRFSDCDIPAGAEIEYIDDPAIRPTVVDDRHIEYNGDDNDRALNNVLPICVNAHKKHDILNNTEDEDTCDNTSDLSNTTCL